MQTNHSYFLQVLRKKRKDLVASCKVNGFHAHRMIAEDIYSKPTRFVYELLQNADDAGATRVSFRLAKNQLAVRHDGERFSCQDVDSITAFGNSTKLPEEGQIGKFGVGFKSVYSVTKTPCVHSGGFHFNIRDYIVPGEISLGEISRMKESETLIILPFDHPRRSAEDAYEMTLRQLDELNVHCLLFLRNIEEIAWENEDDEQTRHSKSLDVDYAVLAKDGVKNSRYLIYRKNISVGGYARTVNVAYKINIDEHRQISVVPAAEENVFVFFPTATPSRLKFIVQAPYKTTLNRESIDFDDEENRQLTKELASLAAESLEDLKKRNLLTSDFFLQILPRIDGGESTHPGDAISNKLAGILRLEALLPVHGGNQHVKAKDALLSSDKGLMKCLGSGDVVALFDRNCWLPSVLGRIGGFLESIGVAIASFDLFLDAVHEHGNFVKERSDDWLIGLYKGLEKFIEDGGYHEKEKRKEKVGKASIIRLDSGEMVAPWGDDGKPQVYLPYGDGRKSEFRTVKRSMVKSPEAKKLFQILGINRPSALSEIKEKIAPRYRNKDHGTEFDQYIEDIKNICKTFDEANNKVRAGIKDVLKDAHIVRAGQGEYVNPSNVDVYLPSEEVKAWFDGNGESHIVDERVVNKKFREFFERLGCKRIDGISQFSHPERHSHGWHEVPVDGFNPTFSIDGLEHSVRNISVQRSRILWQQLLKHYKHIRGHVKKASDQNYVHRVEPTEENSRVGAHLSKNRWLYDKRENLIEPGEYAEKTVDDLYDEYDTEDTRAESLAVSLGLSPKTCSIEYANKRVRDARQEEAAKWESKLINSEKENQELKEKLRKMESEGSDDDDWKPECSPGEGELNGVDPGQSFESTGGVGGHGAPEKSPKSVGDWGEQDVYLFLKRAGHDVEWCNENDEQREPYDIVLRNNDSTIYVEVKSTRNEFPQTFNFTKSEWEFAEKQGDNYHVYFVSRAGKRNREFVRIENPVAEQMRGDLQVTVSETVTRRVRVNKSDD